MQIHQRFRLLASAATLFGLLRPDSQKPGGRVGVVRDFKTEGARWDGVCLQRLPHNRRSQAGGAFRDDAACDLHRPADGELARHGPG